MRMLVINVNTTPAVTDAIGAQARRHASPGTDIVALTPRFGPAAVEGNFESYLAAVAVLDRVATYRGEFDAVVLAGFGEHGREGVQELVDVPVVDITEAAAHTACLLGRTYSVVTSLDRTVPQIEDRLTLAGLSGRCASVRAAGLPVLELEADPSAAVDAIVRAAQRAVDQDRAEVIVLGCAGMAGLDEKVATAAGVPVVDGVAAAVTLAEALHRQGLRTSKVRTYARPRPKTITHWPLSERSAR